MRSRIRKRPTVQLTSLLDLLFVMIFISLLQDKSVPTPAPVESTVAPAPIVEAKPTPQSQFSLTAVFHFFPVSANPEAQTGTFAMAGNYDQKSGELVLGGVSWIQRPEGYDMVPLSGRVMANQNDFTGRVDFPGCQVFSLRRTSQSGSTPISGTWEGTYTCSQGQTGLLLTVQ
jgi:hypothetical protein